MPTSEIKIDVIHSEVGAISESDILLASASNAVVLGFNVPVLQKAEELAKNEKVEVRTYRVVYELADEIRRAIEGMLEPEEKEILSGQALVKKFSAYQIIRQLRAVLSLTGYLKKLPYPRCEAAL